MWCLLFIFHIIAVCTHFFNHNLRWWIFTAYTMMECSKWLQFENQKCRQRYFRSIFLQIRCCCVYPCLPWVDFFTVKRKCIFFLFPPFFHLNHLKWAIVLDHRGLLKGRWRVVSAARSVCDHHLLVSPLPYLVSIFQRRAQWSMSEQTHFINLRASC